MTIARWLFAAVLAALGLECTMVRATEPATDVIAPDAFRKHVERFNAEDRELTVQSIPNAAAWEWLEKNAPRLDCPDKELEEIYCFRWWTYRKHIKQTPDGFVITEFLPQVSWSGKYNTISCAAGHHIYEGRWLRDPSYLNDYARFWFRKGGGNPRLYSFWAADAIYHRYLVTGDRREAIDLLPELVKNYEAWEKSKLDPSGLFWQTDDRDGGECSIGGSGCRATINSYMYGDAQAIAAIAQMADKPDLAAAYCEKAARIKKLVQEKLWDAPSEFFKIMPRGGGKLTDVRELNGYTPWYFNLPDPAYAAAWKQLMDPKGFFAPYGPTTAEQRHPKFAVSYQGHECQWNGPSWPYATAVTLTAMANLLNGPHQDAVTKADYLTLLKIYAKCHHLKHDDGRVTPWIDENLNPFTGDWLSRTRLKTWKNGTWDAGKGGEERGKDYNHSTFCDLVISGLIGLRPRADETIEVYPLVPEGTWDYFCLDRIPYHGRMITILWDKTGERYHRGKGLRILSDGKEVAAAEKLGRVISD